MKRAFLALILILIGERAYAAFFQGAVYRTEADILTTDGGDPLANGSDRLTAQ